MSKTGFQHDQSLRERITDHLNRFKREGEDTGGEQDTSVGAAVTLVVSRLADTAEPCLLVTLRSANLKKHPNQFALPGGKMDAGETVEQTALRELHEEIGLHLDTQAILGRIDDFRTRSGFRISPVVVWHDGNQPIVVNKDEVASVYEIPLTELFLPQIPEIITEDGSDPILTIRLPSIGTRMYTPTASIIFQFREVALMGRDTRVSHYEQPKFAWK